MAESSLSLGQPDFAKEAGQYLGYGPTSANWTAGQTDEVDRLIQRGLRWFYNPGMIPGSSIKHRWSFMRPVTTLVTVAGTSTYTLPDDFGGMDSERMAFAAADGVYSSVMIVPETNIRLWQQSTGSGTPEYAAIRPKAGTGGTNGQRFEILLYPPPGAIYTLSYRYKAHPSKITAGSPYPLGGMEHGETILACILAAGELQLNDEKGIHFQEMLERLNASVGYDTENFAPPYLGYNGDRSDVKDRSMRLGIQYALVNGVLPS